MDKHDKVFAISIYIAIFIIIGSFVVSFYGLMKKECELRIHRTECVKQQEIIEKLKMQNTLLRIENKAEKIETFAPIRYETITMKVTAYCPCSHCCGEYADGITSIGKNAYTKGVAVDPKFIPYGTPIDIHGYGKVNADDCGGAIKGSRLDVRFPTHQEALNWGVKTLKVKVYWGDK